MLDYKLLDALQAVLAEGSFEKAARVLCITPSAVSQRIRQLEERFGQMLLVRSTPVRATAAGHRLLRHVRQVGVLEGELESELTEEAGDGWMTLPIAVNADSLASWFLDAVTDVVLRERLLMQMTLDDEGHTLTLLKNGDVIGCVTSADTPPTGCVSERLGVMRYRCIATPDFATRYFADGVDRRQFTRAPAVIFNRRDTMHLGFLESRYGIGPGDFPHSIVPSVPSLLDVVCAGIGYGLTPELQVASLLASGELVDLLPDVPPQVTLHWHCWALQAPRLARFSGALVAEARARLVP